MINFSLTRFFKKIVLIIGILFSFQFVAAQQKTYCNPVNIDYGYTPIPNFGEWGHHRATADPVIVNYKGDYYLFSTNQWGYWWSHDMLHWTFISRRFLRPWNAGYDELCAPGYRNHWRYDDCFWLNLHFQFYDMDEYQSQSKMNGSLWWTHLKLADGTLIFLRMMMESCICIMAAATGIRIYGVEMNRKTMQPIGTRKEMYFLEDWRYGWQRFGEILGQYFSGSFY